MLATEPLKWMYNLEIGPIAQWTIIMLANIPSFYTLSVEDMQTLQQTDFLGMAHLF